MKTKSSANLQIEALKKDFDSGKLKANPKYQRGKAWGPKQQNLLISSILADFPIGEIVRNKMVSIDGISEEFDIVDGQQRLTALSDFMNDKFALDNENSKEIIGLYLEHFKRSDNKSVLSIFNKYKNGEKNISIKFKNLPQTLQNKISTTEVSVATLSNWEEPHVIKYFTRIQEGKPLTNADKLYTIQTPLADDLKKLSSDENILNCLGLNFDNGEGRKGAHLVVYQATMESIHCKLGKEIGQPGKLFEFFKDKDYTDELKSYVEIFEEFLQSLNTTDKSYINQSSIKTDLKLMCNLRLFGNEVFQNYDVNTYKKFIIDISTITGFLKTFNDKKTTDSTTKFYEELHKSNLTQIYESNKDLFAEFTRFRSGSHNNKVVENICTKISKLYKQTLIHKLEVAK